MESATIKRFQRLADFLNTGKHQKIRGEWPPSGPLFTSLAEPGSGFWGHTVSLFNLDPNGGIMGDPLKLRARDKLAETEYFLDQLRQNKEDLKKLRYCLTAFVSALRSVTLVLQKDLKAQFKKEFEAWWEIERESLGRLPLARALIDLRNVTQKEGNRLPLLQLEFNDDELSGCSMSVQYDLATNSATQIRFGFQDAKTPIQVEAGDISGKEESEVGLELLKRVARKVDFSELTDQFLENVKPSIRIVIDDDETVMAVDDFIEVLEQHVRLRRKIVENAEMRFAKSDSDEVH